MKKYLTVAGLSLLLFFCLVPLGANGAYFIKFTGASVAYCFFTYYWLSNDKRHSKWKVIGAISAPILIICGPIHVLNFTDSLVSLPSTLAHFGGIAAGMFLFQCQTNASKVAFLIPFLVASLWVSTVGYDLWLSKVYYGTYTGMVDEQIPPFLLKESNGHTINKKSLEGKLVVLDFWNTACVNCFKKFPKLEQYHVKYRHDPRVKFFAVNKSLRRDTVGQASDVIKKYGYTFPVLYADDKVVDSLFKVNSFPTVIVIDSSKRIVYRGSLDGLDNLLSAVHVTPKTH